MPNLYRLSNDGKNGGPPVILGSALRVPSEGFANWGIQGDARQLLPLTHSQYFAEFGDTSPSWMGYVIEASNRAGIGNRPTMLQKENAKVAAYLTAEKAKTGASGAVNALDLCAGAGGSAKPYLDALREQGFDLGRLNLTVVDLSPGKVVALEGRREEFEQLGLGEYRVVHARDVDLGAHITGRQDIVFSVAGIHANAYLGHSIRNVNDALKPGGVLVTTDWHTVRWLCPCYTYSLLDAIPADEYNWDTKGKDMDEFMRVFPNAEHARQNPFVYHRNEQPDVEGAQELEKFWRGWMDIRRDARRNGKPITPSDELIMLEGHRPASMYVDTMTFCGFEVRGDDSVVADGVLPANPWQILPDSSLHNIIVARKTM